jgi:hypothetical protein
MLLNEMVQQRCSMDAQDSLVCRVEYTPYNANTLSYGNKTLQLHAYFQVTVVVFLNKALHWKDLVQSQV